MQSQQYTLTNRFMGDPRPDRFEVSNYLRAKLAPSREAVTPASVGTLQKRLKDILCMIADGSDTSSKIAQSTGLSRARVMDYLRRLTVGELVTFVEVRNPNDNKTLMRVYSITADGLEKLGPGQ